MKVVPASLLIIGLAMLPASVPAQLPETVAPSLSAQDQAPVPKEIPVGLLVDLSTGQTLFSRESQRRFVPASVTKVMTAYTAFKLIDEGKLPLDRRFQYTQELEDEWFAEGSNMFLKAGERPTIAQLLLGVTTVSGNDASVALGVAATGSLEQWVGLMNANARELGMQDTHFGSPNGFPDGGLTFSTARDLALLGEATTTRFPGLYKRFFGHRHLTWRDITQANHDPVTGRVDGADGLKTGFTNEAGYTFLGSAKRGGRRLIMVLAGSPSARVRDKAARDLLEWGFAEFEQRTVLPGGTKVGNALVQDGEKGSVALRTPDEVVAALPRGRDGALTMAIIYRGPVEAPIATGDRIARLKVQIDGEPAMDVPLEAAEDIPLAGPFQRIRNAITHWLG